MNISENLVKVDEANKTRMLEHLIELFEHKILSDIITNTFLIAPKSYELFLQYSQGINSLCKQLSDLYLEYGLNYENNNSVYYILKAVDLNPNIKAKNVNYIGLSSINTILIYQDDNFFEISKHNLFIKSVKSPEIIDSAQEKIQNAKERLQQTPDILENYQLFD
ncbi:MAG: hypothetical protein KKF65_01365 [Nanoarchaeota archaeon]|nr:hypothetical protein [Nanoarchaeota archaeon]